MPIYPYVCQSCAHELEALQKSSEPALIQCPACGEEKLVKLLTSPSFHLSGSGWFRDEKSAKSAPAQPVANGVSNNNKDNNKDKN